MLLALAPGGAGIGEQQIAVALPFFGVAMVVQIGPQLRRQFFTLCKLLL